MLLDYTQPLKDKVLPPRKCMVKKGTIDIDVVEITPVVWKGRLMRFEWIRDSHFGNGYYANTEGCCYFRFVDMKTGEYTPAFARNCCFGSAHVEGDTVYVYGVRGSDGGQIITMFRSDDMVNWEQQDVLTFPDSVKVYNNSVCKGRDGYYMAIELGGDKEIVGEPFTSVFAKSDDLIHWTMLDMGTHVYTRERYSACPTIRYCTCDDRYYMIYLESLPCHRWQPYIVRTPDFKTFELGHKNPIMFSDDDDKIVQNPEKFTPEQLEYINGAINCNNSDVDLCEFEGKTVILYSWGNQFGKEFLAEAEYDGPMEEFLRSFFAD
ncbi:MAG: hypothetical protein E7335_08335 [Clostridiales bacterium]|nr:hypothetical protein [Clostridiales bacterium]